MADSNRKDIWFIKPAKNEGGKPFWIKIGTAFVNKDNSLNLKFDVVPPSMDNIQVREQTEREDKFE